MTHIILSNKIDLKTIILIDKETARDPINQIVKEKVQRYKSMDEERRKVPKDMDKFNDQVD